MLTAPGVPVAVIVGDVLVTVPFMVKLSNRNVPAPEALESVITNVTVPVRPVLPETVSVPVFAPVVGTVPLAIAVPPLIVIE